MLHGVPHAVCVFQDWLFKLPMQQQSVLILGCRGPDGISKYHETKALVACYRASVLKAAKYGRAIRPGEDVAANSFMTLVGFDVDDYWSGVVNRFFDMVDCLPHHYTMHLLHGAQIIGYKHPDPLFRQRWFVVYDRGCEDLHMRPETMEEMDERLNDWDREHWN